MKSRLITWACRQTFRCGIIVIVLLTLASWTLAHEVRPAYLQLHQTGAETYDLFWKVPGRGDKLRLSVYVEMPANCSSASQPRGVFANEAFIEEWSVRCANSLTGHTIQIAGLNATMTDVLVRLERMDGTTQLARLTPSQSSFTV